MFIMFDVFLSFPSQNVLNDIFRVVKLNKLLA